MPERFTVVALPHSCAPDAEFHVSLFISPNIQTNNADASLGDCPLFRHWTTALDTAVVTLEDQSGPIECEPLAKTEPGLWEDVFGPETPVTTYVPPDWSDRPWRTYSPGQTTAIARLVNFVATLRSATEPPAVDQLPWFDEEAASAVGWPPSDGTGRTRQPRALDALYEREERRTQLLDRAVESGRYKSAGVPQLQYALLELHRARRFYSRPEDESEYRDRPDPGNTGPEPPEPPIPDFGSRVSLVNDHSPLQRKLGLVVDLRVTDPTQLNNSTWLCGRIRIADYPEATQTVRVACRAVGTALVTLAADETQWINSRLRLGDPGAFDVLDLDPDGSALKTEQYLSSCLRNVAAAAQGAPVNGAPPALRSSGFTVARRGNAASTAASMDRQRTLLDALLAQPPDVTAADAPLLHTEDVMQGVRIDVHDATTGRWRSLHDVVVEARVAGAEREPLTFHDEGFLEESVPTHGDGAAAPIHVHESVFGWDGWSLSAPRPALPVVHDDGAERVVTSPDDGEPTTPLIVTRRAQDQSLPRLRYGRRYAFRAWGVDLAGNSRPHTRQPNKPPTPAQPVQVAAQFDAGPLGAFRSALLQRLPNAGTATPPRKTRAVAGLADVMPAVLARLQAGRGERAPAPSMLGDVSSLLTAQLQENATPTELGADNPAAVATGLGFNDGDVAAGVVAAERQTVTAEHPHLRWHPVPPPAIVPRRAYTEGESNQVLVIRSGVSQDPITLDVTVSDPTTFAAAHPGRFATCERHLVPPKTDQLDAEMHGAFDDAIGSADPAVRNRWLNAAVRDSGTLFDVDVAKLDDPGVREKQDGIALVHGPGAPTSELRTLPLPPGEAPGPGQYVIHDTDLVHTPYLPDVIARGLGFVFPDAGQDRWMMVPFGVDGFTARYDGVWPEIDGYRLVLAGAGQLDGSVEPHLVTLSVPAGTRLRARLSSAMTPADLELLGPWRQLPEGVRTLPIVQSAAANGWIWAVSPAEQITLVHAVPRPVAAPEVFRLVVNREADWTRVSLLGGVDVHGPSTQSLTVEARWDDVLDDLTAPMWQVLPDQRQVAFTTPIQEWEDVVVLAGQASDHVRIEPEIGKYGVHRASHEIGDTKHRLVHYRLRATTRFREYFAPDELEPAPAPTDPTQPIDDGCSTVSAEVAVHVPNTSLPAPPIVHSVLPLFRWDDSSEPGQPMAWRRTRRSGVRVYLERPWFTTGADELVGVVLANGSRPDSTAVSQWGGDPFWLGSTVADRDVLELTHLLAVAGFDSFDAPAAPCGPPVTYRSADDPDTSVVVVPYRPQYNRQRRKWFVDIGFPARFWPFIQLALVRYQPYSVTHRHISRPTVCDFVQLPPERTATVSRTAENRVRVVVDGPVGVHNYLRTARNTPEGTPAAVGNAVSANRDLVAKLQRRAATATSDLAWTTVAEAPLEARGFAGNLTELAWVGELPVPEELPFGRPTTPGTYRVRIEEWEKFAGDPADLTDPTSPVTTERRLIYADEFELGTP